MLLGDPNQLPQVSQGAQPDEARVSVLQHLLGDDETVPAERGIFLDQTRRLRPELCRFTSEAYYEGRLAPWDECATRTVAARTGSRCCSSSTRAADSSRGRRRRPSRPRSSGCSGRRTPTSTATTRPLTEADVLVVAPYNAQVRRVARDGAGRRARRHGRQVPGAGGTRRDRLVRQLEQRGRAARDPASLFDRHRVNVATSRAQCRVVLVVAPRLLEADCKTVEDMRLVNAVCRFVELATPVPA